MVVLLRECVLFLMGENTRSCDCFGKLAKAIQGIEYALRELYVHFRTGAFAMAEFVMSPLRASARSVLIVLAGAAQAHAASLPDGEGRALVENVCTACHSSNQLTRSSGYSRDDWQALTATMVDLSTDTRRHNLMLDYLAKIFPPNTRRKAVLVDGSARITFKEWVTPTLGQRSRDPVEAPDGSIWWAGQWGNLLGRIDPADGSMREFALPAGAMPHSVSIDRVGHAWYTGNKNGSIGKLDPATGKITVYPMPDSAAGDPHTAIFDANGILWFTAQHSNMIGRLDPATGDVRLVTMKTLGARPYGIKIDAHGVPWVACNGSNCLVRVDPATMTLTEIRLPNDATTVRRLDIASDGMIWYVEFIAGPAWPIQPGDRGNHRVAVTERAEIAPLRDRSRRWHRVVQRIACAARYTGAL